MNPAIEQFADADALAQAVAGRWLARVDEARTVGRGVYLVGVPGGRIAVRMFRAVVCLAAGSLGRFGRVEFFWGDERCVGPEEAESNYRAAREGLLEPLGIDVARVHRLRGEWAAVAALADAERALGAVARLDHGGWPVLDLVMVGLGEDGHVASLFPNGLVTAVSPAGWYAAVVGPKPPPRRLTMTLPLIAAAREVWVLASGAGKEWALRASLEVGGSTPLAGLLRAAPSVRIFTDLEWNLERPQV